MSDSEVFAYGEDFAKLSKDEQAIAIADHFIRYWQITQELPSLPRRAGHALAKRYRSVHEAGKASNAELLTLHDFGRTGLQQFRRLYCEVYLSCAGTYHKDDHECYLCNCKLACKPLTAQLFEEFKQRARQNTEALWEAQQ